MKTIVAVMVLAFDQHGRDHDHLADRVMKDILVFVGRGFALFAGGPAVLYQYPTMNRSAVVVSSQKREGGPSE